MHIKRKIAIATLLFGGMASLTFVFNMYGWYGVSVILGVIIFLIGMLSFEEETEE